MSVGLGIGEPDTRTNSITIRDVQVSHLDASDTDPNEYVTIVPTGSLRLNGAAFSFGKQADYDTATGQVTFADVTAASSPSRSHILLLTDSFGALNSCYVADLLYYGVNGLPPQYVITASTVSGRELEDAYQTSLLQQMYDMRAHPDAAAPGVLAIQMGVNDFVIDSGATAAHVDSILQWYIDFAHANDMVAAICTSPPFKGFLVQERDSWTPAKETERDAYNALVRARSGMPGITVVDLDSALDSDRDDVIDDNLSNDNLHPYTADGRLLMATTYHEIFMELIDGGAVGLDPAQRRGRLSPIAAAARTRATLSLVGSGSIPPRRSEPYRAVWYLTCRGEPSVPLGERGGEG